MSINFPLSSSVKPSRREVSSSNTADETREVSTTMSCIDTVFDSSSSGISWACNVYVKILRLVTKLIPYKGNFEGEMFDALVEKIDFAEKTYRMLM